VTKNRINKAIRVSLLICFFLFGACYLFASSNYKPKIAEPITETWRWQNFSELSGKGCQCMVEMPNGTVFFGVSGGIEQYDGLNWKYFQIAPDFTDIPVVSMCVTSDNTIYAGTTRGVKTFKNGKWGQISVMLSFGDSTDFPYNKFPIIESSDHSIWVGSKEGVLRIKDGNYNLYREDKTYIGINKKKDYCYDLKKRSEFDVYSLLEDKAGNIWIGLRDGRVYNCKLPFNDMNSGLTWNRVDTKGGYRRALFPLIQINNTGKMFIISGAKDGGINISKGKGWEQVSLRKKFNIDNQQNDIIRLKDGTLCIGDIGRVFFVKNDKWSMYERTRLPFPSNRLRLFQTSNNNLWVIGLNNDVWRIDLSYDKWITYYDLNFQAEEKNGNQWFITSEGAAVRYSPKNNSWVQYKESDGLINVPVSIFVTKHGDIWAVGSHNNIAATAYFNGNTWVKQLHPQLSWGIDRRAILEDNDGSLWFGTCSDFDNSKGQFGGLVRYFKDNNSNPVGYKYKYYPCNEEFKLYGIYGLAQSGNGDIWAGQLGFYKLNHSTGKWEKIYKPFGLSQNFVDCVKAGVNGDIWVGTRTNGVFRYDYHSKKWIQFTTKNGLSSNSILDIRTESNGNVWIATDKEISHFDGSNWTNNVFPYVFKYMRDGISLRASENGELWVNLSPSVWFRRALYDERITGGKYGEFKTTRYNPDKLQPSTQITFAMDRVAQPGNVILSWTANNLWKTTPETQIQFSYRFDDGQWSSFSGKTSEIFLSLPSGKHVFEVKSRNRDMNVDPTPASVTFYVEPPIWKTPWFIILILSFLATITFFIIHLYRRNKIIQELSETRARLYTNISHELRTPLTLILGSMTKIHKISGINKELRQPLNLMHRNSQRLLKLINQILDYRKIEAGQMKFEPCKGDIIEFIHEEYLSFINEAEAKEIEIGFSSELERLDIWFDPDKIEKIMFNLLSNAVKFTPSGKTVNVDIKIEKKPEEVSIQLSKNNYVKVADWLNITVKDTGIGIAEEDLGKIFDRFYQVHDHSATITGGTGIGLSVAKEMAKIQCGELFADSILGVGTTFYLKIPVINQDIIEKTANYCIKENAEIIPEFSEETEKTIEKENGKHKSKILIVEDNTDMRRFIKSELIDEYDVAEAIDGIDGFNKAITSNPDLIISDIMMPRMDGIELCKKLKLDERTSHISVILLTARSSRENMLEGLETGADDYLGKPFNNEELKLRIRNIIDTRNKIREKFCNMVSLEPENIAVTPVDKKLIEKAIKIVEEHMDDADFNVETFSELVGMHRVSLYNRIKAITNLAPREFFTMIRLKRAEQLLRESGLTVTEIAYQVGFKDPSHFSKLFKKQFGVSPREYIKNSDSTGK